jgi:ribosome-associated protein
MNTSPIVPESEIQLDFVRSSGPGGQNVNKVSSKAQLRWHVGGSQAFSDEQKAIIRVVAGKHLNSQDEIVLSAESERSQVQNKEAVIQRLRELVSIALTPKKKRKPTRVSRAQRRKRLDDKRIIGEKKQSRRSPRNGW